MLFQSYLLSSSMLSSKNNMRYSKNKQKTSFSVLMRLYDLKIYKNRLKMKNWSYRYNVNRPRPRHGHKYTKYKMYLSLIVVKCIKQHLRNILSSVHEKVTQHWDWVEKKHCL